MKTNAEIMVMAYFDAHIFLKTLIDNNFQQRYLTLNAIEKRMLINEMEKICNKLFDASVIIAANEQINIKKLLDTSGRMEENKNEK
jgi:hypothetical protein